MKLWHSHFNYVTLHNAAHAHLMISFLFSVSVLPVHSLIPRHENLGMRLSYTMPPPLLFLLLIIIYIMHFHLSRSPSPSPSPFFLPPLPLSLSSSLSFKFLSSSPSPSLFAHTPTHTHTHIHTHTHTHTHTVLLSLPQSLVELQGPQWFHWSWQPSWRIASRVTSGMSSTTRLWRNVLECLATSG